MVNMFVILPIFNYENIFHYLPKLFQESCSDFYFQAYVYAHYKTHLPDFLEVTAVSISVINSAIVIIH